MELWALTDGGLHDPDVAEQARARCGAPVHGRAWLARAPNE